MAKYYSSTFGKISGKHGNAVAVIRKDGSTYLRLHVPAGNPRTEKQQAHRAKFALTSKSLVPFNPIFKETIGITNGISTARSYAFKNAIVGDYPNLSMDYEKLMFSFGVLGKLHDSSFMINDSVITAKWSCQKFHNCDADDRVSFVIFNKSTNQSVHIKDVANRSDKKVKIDIDDSWAHSDLYLWVYATSGDKISDSVFVERGNTNVDSSKSDVITHNQNAQNEVNNTQVVLSKQDMRINNIALHIISFIKAFVLMLHNLLESPMLLSITDSISGGLYSYLNYPMSTASCRVGYVDVNKIGRLIKPSIISVCKHLSFTSCHRRHSMHLPILASIL